MKKLKYLLSLDLSSSQSGYAIFELNTGHLLVSGAVKKKGKKGISTYCDDNYFNENYLTKGVFLRDLMIKDLSNEIDLYNYNLNGNNTLLVIEKRLSAFSKFSTNKTIESIAQLSQSALLEFAGKKKMMTYHVPVITWQNKIFGAKKCRDDLSTKELSLRYVSNKYGIIPKSDDEADAICIGEYYLNNCIYENISIENVKDRLYKNFVNTQKELFSITFNNCKEKTREVSVLKFPAMQGKNRFFAIDGKNKDSKVLFVEGK